MSNYIKKKFAGRAQKLALQNKLAIEKRKQLACRVEMGYIT